VLKLFAPFVPHIAEEVWQWYFASNGECKSIHLSSWPQESEFAAALQPESERMGNTLVEALGLARKAKSELSISIKKQAKSLAIGFADAEAVNTQALEYLAALRADLLATANVDELVLIAEVLPEGVQLEGGKLKALLEPYPEQA
jgi:valyl-tRNA synthetase